jgi:hypothetical protein
METFKDIPEYEGLYQISSKGNVKSLERTKTVGNGARQVVKTKILISQFNRNNYLTVHLCKAGKQKTCEIHILVWDNFGNEPRNGKQVDHDDNIKIHNWIENLNLKTNRQNTSKGKLQYSKTSQYTGVSWDKSRGKWRAMIATEGRLAYLGRFQDEEVAHQAYQTALQNHLASGGI